MGSTTSSSADVLVMVGWKKGKFQIPNFTQGIFRKYFRTSVGQFEGVVRQPAPRLQTERTNDEPDNEWMWTGADAARKALT